MFAYFNVSEPEYLDYETDIKNRAQMVGLLLANGVPLKYKGTVEVIERMNLIVKQEILPLDLAFQTLINYLETEKQVKF
jgi:hypothetical protein